MNNTIRIRRVVENKIPLLRKPTLEELQMIERDEIFDIEATDLFDFNKATQFPLVLSCKKHIDRPS